MRRGRLNGTQTALTTQTFGQCWNLDATGNWTGFKETDNGSTWTLEQARTANTVNEITAITNTTGTPWSQPRYDKAGNMTTLPGPAITGLDWTTLSTDEWSTLTTDEWAGLPASHTKDATYDAWNRLIKLTDGPTGHTIQENQYDARTFRTIRKDYEEGTLSETRHFHYSPDWRCVEERVDASPDADRQFVWGLRYIDELICRDRDTDSDGDWDERLYACQDVQASTFAAVNDVGSTVECYVYSPFGGVTFLDSSRTNRTASLFSFEHLFTGRQRDESTGLLNFRNRMISPEVGSFIQRDPLDYVNGPSLFAIYFSVNGVDPEGLRVTPGPVGPGPGTRPGIGWGGRPVVNFPGYHYPPHSPGVLPSDAGPQMPPDFSFPSGPSIGPAPGSDEWSDWSREEWEDFRERRRRWPPIGSLPEPKNRIESIDPPIHGNELPPDEDPNDYRPVCCVFLHANCPPPVRARVIRFEMLCPKVATPDSCCVTMRQRHSARGQMFHGADLRGVIAYDGPCMLPRNGDIHLPPD